MPVTATGQAKILTGDADPLEVLRSGDHLPHQLAVLVLDLLSLHQSSPGFGDPVGKLVAERLQLTEVEEPGRGRDGFDPMRHLGVAERLAEKRGQLRLETADLAAQLDPRTTLVDPDPELGELLAFQQSGHLQGSVGQADPRVEAAIHSASSTAICGTPLT